jgi:PAS domain S-box-containing protein
MSAVGDQTAAIDWDAQVSLKLLVESAPIALALVDQRGQIVYVNGKLEELFGYGREELLGKAVEVLMPMRFHSTHTQHRLSYMQQPHLRIMGSGMDLSGVRKDGVEFPLEVGLSYLHIGDELLVIATMTDITKRKQVEEMLEQRVAERTREIERRQQVADGLRAILTMLNSNRSLPETLSFIVTQARSLLQADACAIYSREERSGRLSIQASDGLLPDQIKQLDFVLEQALAQQALLYDEPMIFGEHGQPVAVRSSHSSDNPQEQAELCSRVYLRVPLKDKGDSYGLMLVGYDQPGPADEGNIELAASVADQAALAIANARLHDQIERTAVAAERNRIARDLHDAVTQTLFAASLIAEVLPRIWERNEEEGRKRLAELSELTRGALAEMRTLLLELRPAKLIEVDIADLLRQLAEATAGRARVPITVQIEGDAKIPTDVKLAFYRIAQEALNNVAKHAHAHRVQVQLQRMPDVVELTIRDNGRGFVFEHITPEHLGLGIMRERADAIGATLQILSQPGHGTAVAVRWTMTQ